jgi:hypothetical protein
MNIETWENPDVPGQTVFDAVEKLDEGHGRQFRQAPRPPRRAQLADNLFAEGGSLNLAAPIDVSEDMPIWDAGGARPDIGRHLDPLRHRESRC